jgi:hypothetical protein
MDDNEISELVRDAYDLHFHIGPDILPRKYTVEELVREEAGRIRGVALKSHSIPTIGLINSLKKDGIDLIGSITLNYFMGGFNESAIYASAVMSKEYPIFVWFPTVHAENHLIHNKSQYEIPPEWVKDPNFKPRTKYDLKAIKVTDWAGKLIRKADACLKTVEEMGCVVATGHVSWQEAKKLAEECLGRGLKVIVTHPMQRDIAMPLEVQVELARKGAYIEYCYIMYLDRDYPEDYPLDEQVRCMKAIGADKVILTSDAGQKRNPGSTESLTEYVKLLQQHGMGNGDFKRMLVDNPKRILGQ